MNRGQAIIPVIFLLVAATVYPAVLTNASTGFSSANQLSGSLPANAPRLGYWLQEGDILKGTWQGGYNVGGSHPAQLFFNSMFLTPPYPSSVEIMMFSISQDESAGYIPGAPGSYTAASIAFWSDLASLAEAYPNIKLVYEIAYDPSSGGAGTYGLPAFNTMVSAFGKYSSVYGMGVEGEYTRPSTDLTLAEMQAAMGYVTGTGKLFVSYYVAQSLIPSGGYDIYHTNFPGGDAGGYDQVGSLQLYDPHTIGMDTGYYAPFNFPSTVTCPIGASAMNSATAGWNQCVVSTELSTAVSMPSGTRQFLELDPGFDASGSFVGVSGVTTTQLWDNPTLRNWVWTDPNYQGNFILSTSPASTTTTSTTSSSTSSSSTHSTTTTSTRSTTTTSSTHSSTTSSSTRSTTSSSSTRSSTSSTRTTSTSTSSTSDSTSSTSTSSTVQTSATNSSTTSTQSSSTVSVLVPPSSQTSSGPVTAFLSISGGCPATGVGGYQQGSTATVQFSGVCDRSGGSGLRVTGWSLDGGPSTSVLTDGSTQLSVAMNSSHALTLYTVQQYYLTLDYGAQLSLLSLTPPTVPGDPGWYDGGTVVTFIGGADLNGSTAVAWSLDGAPPVQLSGAPDFISSFPMYAPHALSVVLAPDTPSCPSGACGGSQTFDVTVQTDVSSPSGMYVDGAYYSTPVTFAWPGGSGHTLTAGLGGVKSSLKTTFAHWSGLSDSLAPTLTLNITRGGNLTAVYSTLDLVTLGFTDAGGQPLVPQAVTIVGPSGPIEVGSNLSVWAVPGFQYTISSATWMNWEVVIGNHSTFDVSRPSALTFPLGVYPETIKATDVYNLPLQGAVVNITSLDGETLQATTNAQGLAEFRVPMGVFNATVSYLGVSSNIVEGTQGAHDLTATFVLSYPLVGTVAAVASVAALGTVLFRLRKKPEAAAPVTD